VGVVERALYQLAEMDKEGTERKQKDAGRGAVDEEGRWDVLLNLAWVAVWLVCSDLVLIEFDVIRALVGEMSLSSTLRTGASGLQCPTVTPPTARQTRKHLGGTACELGIARSHDGTEIGE